MCLRVNKSVKAKKVNSSGYCVGWKLMTPDKGAIYAFGEYKIGLNISNRQNKKHSCDTNLDDDHIQYKQPYHPSLVGKGFHLFLKRDDARYTKTKNKNFGKQNFLLIKVLYKPSNVVAYGKCSIHSNAIVLDKYITFTEEQQKISNMDNVVVMSMEIPSFDNHR